MSDTTLPPLKILKIYCPHCPTSPVTYITLGELEAHLMECHQRPVHEAESLARLATEAGVIGRARQGTWAPDMTHWHAARIQARDGEAGAAK